MEKPEFKHYDLRLVEPSFNSPLTDLIIELDYLRKKPLKGSTHPKIFFQLKHIFHTLESIGSARIEGNNTTIIEYTETKLEPKISPPSNIKEIQNIEESMDFVDAHIEDFPTNKLFVSEIHKKIVQGLLPPSNGGEGD